MCFNITIWHILQSNERSQNVAAACGGAEMQTEDIKTSICEENETNTVICGDNLSPSNVVLYRNVEKPVGELNNVLEKFSNDVMLLLCCAFSDEAEEKLFFLRH